MADGVEGYFRNDASKEDSRLPEDLKKYVQQLFTRNEILSFMRRDFPSYGVRWWAYATLLIIWICLFFAVLYLVVFYTLRRFCVLLRLFWSFARTSMFLRDCAFTFMSDFIGCFGKIKSSCASFWIICQFYWSDVWKVLFVSLIPRSVSNRY